MYFFFHTSIYFYGNVDDVVKQKQFCHITLVLIQLHWLPVLSRVNFKILLLTFKVLHGLAPSYISDLIRVKPVSSRYSHRSADGILRFEPKFKTLTTLR